MRIRIVLEGTTPLMMHNERLANADDKFTQQIKEITDKGKNQTKRDKDELSKLEWFGGIYTDSKGDIALPAANLIKCFREAAAVTKEGKNVAKALTPITLNYPLINGASNKPDELFKNAIYIDKRSVGIGRRRITRTRPIFPKWSVAAEFELLDDVMNLENLIRIVELAGLSTGLGDARIIGYGRFSAKVKKI